MIDNHGDIALLQQFSPKDIHEFMFGPGMNDRVLDFFVLHHTKDNNSIVVLSSFFFTSNIDNRSQRRFFTKLRNKGIEMSTKCFLFPFMWRQTWLMIAVDCIMARIIFFRRCSIDNNLYLNSQELASIVVRLNDLFLSNDIPIMNFTNVNIHGDYSLYQCGTFIVYAAKMMASNLVIDGEQSLSTFEDIDQFKLEILAIILEKMIEQFNQIST